MGSLKRICRPPRDAQSPQKGHHPAVMPPVEREESDPPPAPYFFGKGCTVEIERACRVARMCRAIDKSLPDPKRTKHKAFVWFAWRWDGKPYACDPSRRMHLSAATLRYLYYSRWLPGGKTVEALKRRYRSCNQKVSRDQIVDLARLCLASDTKSFSAGYRRLGSPGATESAFRHAMPAPFWRTVAKLLAHRRREQVLLRSALLSVQRYLEEPENTELTDRRGAGSVK